MYGSSPLGPPPSNFPPSSHLSSSFGQPMYHVSPAGRAPPLPGSAATSIVSPSQRVVQLSLSQDQRAPGAAPSGFGRMPPVSDLSGTGGPASVVSTGIQASSAPGGVGLPPSSFRTAAPPHRFGDSSMTAHLSAGSLPSTAGVSALSAAGVAPVGTGVGAVAGTTGINGSVVGGLGLVSGIPQSRDAYGLHSQQMMSAISVGGGAASSMEHRRRRGRENGSDEDLDAAAAAVAAASSGSATTGVGSGPSSTASRFADQTRPTLFDSMVKGSEDTTTVSADATARRLGGKAQIIKPPMQPLLSDGRTPPQSLTTSAPASTLANEIDQGVTEINIDVGSGVRSGLSADPATISDDSAVVAAALGLAGSADPSSDPISGAATESGIVDQSSSSAVDASTSVADGTGSGSAAAVAGSGGAGSGSAAAAAAATGAESATAGASRMSEPLRKLPKYSESTLRFLGTPVEVRDHETGAFFDAYLLDYYIRSQKCLIAYSNGWKDTKEVELTDIRSRYRWDKLNLQDWTPKIGEKVECLAKADIKEPFGYWMATVQSIDRPRQIYQVSFDGWDSTDNQNVPKNMLRPLKGMMIRRKKLVFVDESEASIKLVNSVKKGNPILSVVDGFTGGGGMSGKKKSKGSGGKSKLDAAIYGSGAISKLSDEELYESYYPRMWDWIGQDLLDLKRRMYRDNSMTVTTLLTAPECTALITSEVDRIRKKCLDRMANLKQPSVEAKEKEEEGSGKGSLSSSKNYGDLLHIGYWPPIMKTSGSGLSLKKSKSEGKIVIVCSHSLSMIEELKISLKYLLDTAQRMYTRIAVDEKLFKQERDYQSVLNRLKECKKVRIDFLMKYIRYYSKDKLELVKKLFNPGDIVEICVSTPPNGGGGGSGSSRMVSSSLKSSPLRGGGYVTHSPTVDPSEDYGQCVIFGNSEKACREASDLLDLTELYIEIPKHLVAEFVGKGGLNVRMLEDRTHVIHIQSFDRHCRVLGLKRSTAAGSSSSRNGGANSQLSDAVLKQAVADLGDPVTTARDEDSAPVLSRRGRKTGGPAAAAVSASTSGSAAMVGSSVADPMIVETETYVIFGPKKFVSIAAEMVKVELDTCQRRRELQDKFYSLDRELYESNTAQNGSMVRTFYYDEFAGGMSQRQKEEQRKREAAAPVMSSKLRGARSTAASAGSSSSAASSSSSSASATTATADGGGRGARGGASMAAKGGGGGAKYVRKTTDKSGKSKSNNNNGTSSGSLSSSVSSSADPSTDST